MSSLVTPTVTRTSLPSHPFAASLQQVIMNGVDRKQLLCGCTWPVGTQPPVLGLRPPVVCPQSWLPPPASASSWCPDFRFLEQEAHGVEHHTCAFSSIPAVLHSPTGQQFSARLYCPINGHVFYYRCACIPSVSCAGASWLCASVH